MAAVSMGDPEVGFLSLLMIGAQYRRNGLGAAVVREVEKTICETGHPREIRSGVQVNNPQAIRFWQRMGYTIVSDAEPMLDGTVCYRLWKAV
jgi:ribosomal protein S18 acetylase RimI-like enzyme